MSFSKGDKKGFHPKKGGCPFYPPFAKNRKGDT
jgi:hypothetical protein